MKKVIGDVVGAPIHYALVINFQGFTDLVNAIGGVEVTLDKPFDESLQFNETRVCDSYTFTKPTGKYENKYYTRMNGTKYLAKSYPLCSNPNTECGGDFTLPAGKQTLAGDKALCYARARKTSSDFERAKRQQYVIQQIKAKALSVGTLSDFTKVNAMLDSLGNNVKTDMQGWEMKQLFELEQKMQNPQILQHVLENSDEGLLYTPQSTPETGYILAPIGDNYDKIHDLFKNIFNIPSQSDAKPV
jgi:anionic cell wall polymer biosynthesis LytR-Cps2A-Psr (LCP) family protein